MTITEFIQELEHVREQYGNLPIYWYCGGGEQVPHMEVTDTKLIRANTDLVSGEVLKVPAERRVLIHW